MTFDIGSQFSHSCFGIGQARMLSTYCLSCRHTWGTPACATRTGFYRRAPSSWDTPQRGFRSAGESVNEARQPRPTSIDRGILHRAADASAKCQSAHHRVVSGHVPLLLTFAHTKLQKSPSNLDLRDIDAPLVSLFLDNIETRRSASARTRNLRLTAIRAFFRFIAFEEPAYSQHIQRILAIPSKRHDRTQVHFLTRPEIEAVPAAPDRMTWVGRRDHLILLIAVQTGLRLSELIGLDRGAVSVGVGAHVRCFGKGRKERCTPLTKYTVAAVQAWLKETSQSSAQALFPNIRGGRLSSDAVQYMLTKYVAIARTLCPSLKQKQVSPHVLRHTAAMELLQAGVDCSVIALWLGHESVETTQVYLHTHLALK
jgi:integrase/recombinase XerD